MRPLRKSRWYCLVTHYDGSVVGRYLNKIYGLWQWPNSGQMLILEYTKVTPIKEVRGESAFL